MKEINAEIYINWDNDGATVKFSDEEAEKLLALWKEAQDTILHDVEEEDYWEKFDPWLQEKAPDLYEKIMKAFHEEFWERMGCYSSNRDDYDFVYIRFRVLTEMVSLVYPRIWQVRNSKSFGDMMVLPTNVSTSCLSRSKSS